MPRETIFVPPYVYTPSKKVMIPYIPITSPMQVSKVGVSEEAASEFFTIPCPAAMQDREAYIFAATMTAIILFRDDSMLGHINPSTQATTHSVIEVSIDLLDSAVVCLIWHMF